jgi:hypothetical protein
MPSGRTAWRFIPMNDGAGLLADTLGTAFAILAVTLGPILTVAAVCLVIREICKYIRSST